MRMARALGIGGHATATTTISNSGNLLITTAPELLASRMQPQKGMARTVRSRRTRIDFYAGSATGGVARAGVYITNHGSILSGGVTAFTVQRPPSRVVALSTRPSLVGPFSTVLNPAYTAVGGTAIATTTISNTGYIHSYCRQLVVLFLIYMCGSQCRRHRRWGLCKCQRVWRYLRFLWPCWRRER